MPRSLSLLIGALLASALLVLGISLCSWPDPASEDDPTVGYTPPALPDQNHTWVKVEMSFGETGEIILPERVPCNRSPLDPSGPPPGGEQFYPVRYWPHVVGPDDCYDDVRIKVNDVPITLSAPNEIIGIPNDGADISVTVPSIANTRNGVFYRRADEVILVKNVSAPPDASMENLRVTPVVFVFTYYRAR